jgi:hypothetical protein
MFYPISTGSQIASHDAWLAEMRKEPSSEIGQVVGPGREKRAMRGVASRLARAARRLRSRSWPEVSAAPEAPAQATGTSV